PYGARSSLLAGRAKEGRASGLDDALDPAFAAGGRAGLSLAVVDAEIVLKQAEFAVGALVVAQRRAAGLDRLRQHGLDPFDEPHRALVRRPRAHRRRTQIGRAHV